MAIKNAPYCKNCHKVKTKHPLGLCSACRRSAALSARSYCKLCGQTKTSHESGICYDCRRNTPKASPENIPEERIKAAIADLKLSVFILERRLAGDSFGKIAEKCGMSKSACFNRYMLACPKKDMPGFAEELFPDGDNEDDTQD